MQEGASLILGPLRADQVTAAGSVARSAGIPLIGFSNNSGAAQPGVYLLNVLPESEVQRSMAYAKSQGKRAYAGIFPNTEFGRIQQGAFTQAAADLGLSIKAVYNFSSEAEARDVVAQIAPTLQAGQIDALFLPDRATAPSFGVAARGGQGRRAAPSRSSARPTGTAIKPSSARPIWPAPSIRRSTTRAIRRCCRDYQQRFGGKPHAFVDHRLYGGDPRQCLGAVAGIAALRPDASHLARRLQRPRRRVPVPRRRPQPNMRW